MRNPWVELPRARPFVLRSDLPFVNAFNRGLPEFSPTWIHTGRLPEPRLGPTTAPVVVLQKNPSYDDRDLSEPEISEGLAALVQEDSPHSCLAEPNDWWNETFAAPLKEFGRMHLSRRVMSVEYFSYASLRFGHAHLRLPSQEYTFSLVRAALERGAVFVVTRGLDLWVGAIPQLQEHLHSRVFVTRNRQRAFVSERNLLGDRAYATICEHIAG